VNKRNGGVVNRSEQKVMALHLNHYTSIKDILAKSRQEAIQMDSSTGNTMRVKQHQQPARANSQLYQEKLSGNKTD